MLSNQESVIISKPMITTKIEQWSKGNPCDPSTIDDEYLSSDDDYSSSDDDLLKDYLKLTDSEMLDRGMRCVKCYGPNTKVHTKSDVLEHISSKQTIEEKLDMLDKHSDLLNKHRYLFGALSLRNKSKNAQNGLPSSTTKSMREAIKNIRDSQDFTQDNEEEIQRIVNP